eukprot:6491940-Amphidinium_carterae.1
MPRYPNRTWSSWEAHPSHVEAVWSGWELDQGVGIVSDSKCGSWDLPKWLEFGHPWHLRGWPAATGDWTKCRGGLRAQGQSRPGGSSHSEAAQLIAVSRDLLGLQIDVERMAPGAKCPERILVAQVALEARSSGREPSP